MSEKEKFDEFSQLISDFTDTTPDSDVAESLEFMQNKLKQRPDDWRAHLAVAQILTRNFTRHGITRDLFDEAGGHIDAALNAMPGTLYKLKDLLNKSSVSGEQAAETLRDAVQNVAEMINKYSNLWKEFSDSEEEIYRKPLREGLENHERELNEARESLSETDVKLAELREKFDETKSKLDDLKNKSRKFGIFKWIWILFAVATIAAFSFSKPFLGVLSIIVGILSLLPYFISRSKVSKFETGEFSDIERKLSNLESERSHILSDIEFHVTWINGKKEYL